MRKLEYNRNVSLFPSAGHAVQEEEYGRGRGDGGEARKHGGATNGAAGAAMPASGGNDE